VKASTENSGRHFNTHLTPIFGASLICFCADPRLPANYWFHSNGQMSEWLSAFAASPLRRDIPPQLAARSGASEGG
jgi:hypothetical protein